MRNASEDVYSAGQLKEQVFGCESITDDASKLPTEEEGIEIPITEPSKASYLAKFDVTTELGAIEQQQTESFFVIDSLAQKGRWTVIYAAPNLGKTLITLALLTKSLEERPEQAKHTFYVNADDNLDGVLEKGNIAAEYGFSMLVPGYKKFRSSDITSHIDKVCAEGLASKTTIIIDTLKKAVDLMKKSHLRAFGQTVRNFVSVGGTVITLAHTNKNVGSDGKPVPEGTADIINDADCVYLAYEVETDTPNKSVLFECRKTRGGDTDALYIHYSGEKNLTYQQLLSTVEIVDDPDLEGLKPVLPLTSQDIVINAIVEAINAGVNTKMKIRDKAAQTSKASKREVVKVLEEFTGDDPETHRWNFTRGERGRQLFELHANQNSRIPDSQIPAQNELDVATRSQTTTETQPEGKGER